MSAGRVLLETVTVKGSTLTAHNCWDITRFKEQRQTEAQAMTNKGDPTAVRFLDVTEYLEKGGKL